MSVVDAQTRGMFSQASGVKLDATAENVELEMRTKDESIVDDVFMAQGALMSRVYTTVRA